MIRLAGILAVLLAACGAAPTYAVLPPVPAVDGLPAWRLETEVGTGTAAPVGERTFITAAHVVREHAPLSLERGDRLLVAVDHIVHPELDVALVFVDEDVEPVPLFLEEVRFPRRVYAVGLIVGRFLYASEGIVTVDGVCSAPISRGMSGGPVLTEEMEIVGVVSAALVQVRAPHFLDHVHRFVPVSAIRDWLTENVR